MQRRHILKKLLFLAPFSALLVYASIKGAIWLVAGLAVIIIITFSFNCKLKWTIFISQRNWLSYPLLFLLIMVTAICIRMLFFEIYYIPSDSMRDTLYPGDRVLVEKVGIGPRLPANVYEIPWVNVGFYLAWKIGFKKDAAQWPYRRLKGISPIQHNDLVVYNLHEHPGQAFIKRCVALPGDTFEIRNAKVFVNGVEIVTPPLIRHYCRIFCHDRPLAREFANNLKIPVYQVIEDDDYLLYAFLNHYQIGLLETSPAIDKIEIETNRPDSDWITAIWDPANPWTIDNFGPLVIPAKGMSIELDKANILLYRTTFDEELAEMVSGNRETPNRYTFNQDFFFVLGDHRHDSRDSRYTGLVPEKDIIGKAILLLFNLKAKNGNKRKPFTPLN